MRRSWDRPSRRPIPCDYVLTRHASPGCRARCWRGLGLVASVGLGGALIYALQTRDGGGPTEELYSTENRSTADGLAGLPRDYSGVPRLGPPLPGDLGRPILDAQNRGQPVPAPGIATPNPGLSAEEQRRLQEIETARTSRLFSRTENRTAPAAGAGSAAVAAPPTPDLTSRTLAPATGHAAAQDRQLAFLNAAVDRRTVSPDRVAAPASPNILQAGAVIPAALITGIRSDLPGQITAQVTENVYDSPTGRILLVPQGTRLIGQYDNGVGFGQRRILLVWNRLIMPNGRSIVLERQPGADSEGYAGLEDGVDYHWWDLAQSGRALDPAQRRRRSGIIKSGKRHRARPPTGASEKHQRHWPADRQPPTQHRTDADHPARIPGARDRYARPRARTLWRLI